MDNSIVRVLKSAPVLTPDDSVRRTAGLMRSSSSSRIFVHRSGQIIGVVTEQAISNHLARSENTQVALDSIISDLVDTNVVNDK